MALVLRTMMASGVPMGDGQGKQALVRQNNSDIAGV